MEFILPQSEIASEKPGVLDCLQEGATRLMGWNTSQTTRLLPIWKLLLPSTGYLLARYVTTSLAAYTVNLSMQQEHDAKVTLCESVFRKLLTFMTTSSL